MVIFLFIGIIGVFILIFFKDSLIERVYFESEILQKLKNFKWFQNQWLAGLFLFFANAILFSFVVIALFLLTYFRIPFIHLIVALLAVIISVILWVLINKAWQGTKANRLRMGLVGSSFYIILTFVFVYKLVTLKPSYPGDDTFMAGIGLMFGIVITTVAFITCLIITGFEKRKRIHSL